MNNQHTKEKNNTLKEKLIRLFSQVVADEMILNSFVRDKIEILNLGEESVVIGVEDDDSLNVLSGYMTELEDALKQILNKEIKPELVLKNDFVNVSDVPLSKTKAAFTKKLEVKFKEDLLFENFVVSSFNKEVYQACNLALENPDEYNPVFIFGKSGLGKTHILNAIGN